MYNTRGHIFFFYRNAVSKYPGASRTLSTECPWEPCSGHGAKNKTLKGAIKMRIGLYLVKSTTVNFLSTSRHLHFYKCKKKKKWLIDLPSVWWMECILSVDCLNTFRRHSQSFTGVKTILHINWLPVTWRHPTRSSDDSSWRQFEV